jgi:hypothetical protein
VADWVEEGRNLERDGVIRWRCVDLQRRFAQAFVLRLHERMAGKLLRSCPATVGTSATATEQTRGTSGFQRSFTDLMTTALSPEAAGMPVEIWLTEEARGGQPRTLSRVWGLTPRALRDRRFQWASLFGAICPECGTGAAIIFPEVNVAAMNQQLAEISCRVSAGGIALMVLDGAGWHSSPRLELPENIVLLPLSPD